MHSNNLLKKFIKTIKILKINTFDIYILRSFLLSFFGSLLLFISIYELVQIFQDLRWIPHGADGKLLFLHYFNNALYWMFIFMPFSFLFATVYSLSKLAHTRELIAIISSGTSIFRITIYILLFSILVYFLNIYYLEDKVIFPSYQRYFILREIVFHNVDPSVLDKLKDNRNFSLFGENNLLYIGEYYDAVKKEMRNITIIKFRDITTNVVSSSGKLYDIKKNETNIWILTNINEIIQTRELEFMNELPIQYRIDAERAIWNKKNNRWLIYNGVYRTIGKDKFTFKVTNFEKRYFDDVKDPPFYFERVWYTIDAMTIKEAKMHVEKLIRAREDFRDEKARYLSKFSYPIGMILVVLVGIGVIDISRRKLSIVLNLVTSLFIFTIYYLFFAVGLSLAGKGVISPELGAYMGTIFFSVVALILYFRTKT